MTAVQGHSDAQSIAHSLGLPLRRVSEVLEFLIRAGLVRQTDQNLEIGPRSTHLEASSPWVRVHHLNWRERAMESLSRTEDPDLHYSAPMTLSLADSYRVREIITQMLQEIDKVVMPSPSEQLSCLTLDWFQEGKPK